MWVTGELFGLEIFLLNKVWDIQRSQKPLSQARFNAREKEGVLLGGRRLTPKTF